LFNDYPRARRGHGWLLAIRPFGGVVGTQGGNSSLGHPVMGAATKEEKKEMGVF